jgi:hypothetical protein
MLEVDYYHSAIVAPIPIDLKQGREKKIICI